MKKYRKKPMVIEATEFVGENYNECLVFTGLEPIDPVDAVYQDVFIIQTLEGVMKASVGDYIIKGVKGEFYPCKPDIFKQTYEPVEGK